MQESTGAKLEPIYHNNAQEIVGVPVMDIRDARPSIKEEIAQTALGGFMASGSFWLGVERLFTIGYRDPLFLACIAFLTCGLVLMIVGARQGLRRVNRLERYLPENQIKKHELESVS